MSASDKKQQRKAAKSEELTQKQRREQAEAKSAKQKKLAYTVIGVVCAVAAAALLVWNNLNAFDRFAVAATVDGVDYKVPDLQYYYAQAKNYTYNLNQQYLQAYGFSIFDYDSTQSDGEQWYSEEDNKTYADYFREGALERLKQTAALCKAAKEAGYTLSADGEETVQEQLDQINAVCAQYGITRASYFAQSYGKGVTEKVFVRNLRNDLLAEEYAEKHEDDISYDEDALKAYYDEHPDELDSYDYRSFFISGAAADPVDENGEAVKDADGNTVTATDEEKAAAMSAAKEKADDAVNVIQSSDDKEKAFINAAPNYVAESSKGAYEEDDNYSLSEGVLGSRLTQTGSVMADWLMDETRKAGDVTALEVSGSGYYVVLFLDRYLVQDPTVNIRHILIRPEVADDAETNANGVQKPTDEAMAAAKEEAQKLMDEWKAGEATAESFGKLAEEYSSDGGSNTNGGKYTYVSKGDMVPNFDAWIFDPARQPGDVGLVENSGDDAGYYGWHVIYFEKSEEPAWKGTAIEAKKSADQTEWSNSVIDSVEAVAASGMSKVGDANTVVPTPSETPAESAEPTASPAA